MKVAFLVVLGLCMGSFVEALVWRLHQQETRQAQKTKPTDFDKQLSIMTGRSMCPHCHHRLSVSDLIPLFSWLFLRGKCRYCHQPIGKQAPLTELATAGLMVLSYLVWPFAFNLVGSVQFGFWLVFIVGFVALIAYDYHWLLLPNKIVYCLTGLAVVQVVLVGVLQKDPKLLVGSLLGSLVLGGLFLVLFQISAGKWIGGGDVKLGAMLGILLGSPLLSLLVLFMASTGGSLLSLPLLMTGKVKRSTRIPFGPLLLIAAIVAQLFGRAIISWYQKALIF